LFSHKSKSNNSVTLSLCLSLCAKKKQRDAWAQTAVSKLERSNKRRSRCESGSRTINPQTKTTTPPATYRGREQTNKQTTDPPNTHKAQNTTTPTQQTKHNQAQQLKWDKTKQNTASHKTQTEEAGRRHMYVWLVVVVVVVVVQQKREGERSA
jgi:hypothetical protein